MFIHGGFPLGSSTLLSGLREYHIKGWFGHGVPFNVFLCYVLMWDDNDSCKH
jgi:hypothetical protein